MALILKQFFLCMGITFLFLSCKSSNEKTITADYLVRGDTIIVSGSTGLKNKLKIIPVQSEPYRIQMLTAGTVRAIPTQYAEIAPPFRGRITRSYLNLGMKTRPGTPLFEITSPDFMEAQKVFFQEKSQLEQAGRHLQRQQDLVKHGVAAQKDLEEAQTAYVVERKEYENAAAGIRLFKADPDRLTLGQSLIVRAPISGEVLENKVVLGQFIKDDAGSIALVADLSQVWIAAQIKEKDIPHIHEADECYIEISALPGKSVKGKIYHVNQIVDEATRSIEVLILADNAARTLKPGMYVTARFVGTPVTSILIPAKALLQMNDDSFVFVEIASGRYIRRKVITGSTSDDRTMILSGLAPGERIITEGAFYLLEAK